MTLATPPPSNTVLSTTQPASQAPLVAPDDTAMAVVRKVITGELDERVKHLEATVLEKSAFTHSTASALGDVFAVADGLGNRKKLIESMASPVIDATQAMGLTEPHRVAKALAPIILKAIATGVQLAMADIRRNLKSTSPVQRFMWKLESKRTGIAVEQLVARDLYPYSIVAAWVFEADTGQLLAHERQKTGQKVGQTTEKKNDPDAALATSEPNDEHSPHASPETTSALLASIRMFALEHGLLESHTDVQFYESGTQKIWLYAQDNRVLAVQVDGEPDDWENRFRTKATSILSFTETAAVQAGVSHWVKQGAQPGTTSKKFNFLGALLLLALAALLAQRIYMGYTAYTIERHLAQQAGVMSSQVDSSWTSWRVRTVADPAVAVPSSLETAQISSAKRIVWMNTPIWSPDPALVLLRLNTLKRQFPALTFKETQVSGAPSILAISGMADSSTQQSLYALLKQTPAWLLGAAQYDTSGIAMPPSGLPASAPSVLPLAVPAAPQ